MVAPKGGLTGRFLKAAKHIPIFIRMLRDCYVALQHKL